MPELPEVEIFKRYLDATSLHQRISRVAVRNAYVLKGVSGRELANELRGRSFECSCRHGKHLFVRADGDLWLQLHFGMTACLRYFKDEEKPASTASADTSAEKHERVIFIFGKGRRLAFDDQRMFGEVGLLKDVDEFLKKRALGPDALKIKVSQFKSSLRKHRGAIKSILMNQKLIAGIGNIYADEILFRSRLHPATEVSRLSDKGLAKLFRAMRYILQKAIKAKADMNHMPRSWLLPHRSKSGKCPRCGGELTSAKVGGRTAWFCALCQKQI